MSDWIKLKADRIFDGQHMLHGKVLVLEADGTVEALLDAEDAGLGITECIGMLTPGFVNTHCHLELSHMQGVIPEGTGLPLFLQTVMEKRNGGSDPLKAMTLAAARMIEEGVVAVGDICNSPATLALKQHSHLYFHTFVETMGFIPAGAPQRLEQSLAVLEQFRAIDGPQHRSSIVPHAPYSVSKALFNLLASLPGNALQTIHNQETLAEASLYLDKTGAFLDFFRHFGMDISGFAPTGKNSLQSCLPYFNDNSQVILVHNTFTTETDIRFAQQQPQTLYWCVCPNANLYIEKQVADIPLLMRTGCTITMGTDSLASNHQLSMWAEIAAIREAYPGIPLEDILQWATLNGAKALQIDDRYGSFERGKQPGVVLVAEDISRKLY
ncbi:amidohydrolase [Chitinophaga parva]|uniref:Amidohydrolase n=1 Tax=Chitinophaga parva TaxID=2169414 RepID=A0A2T7BMD6_9BACT|nr:amidohydrolase family protein [Chitinophaga parva]PUZ28816.1 amidohydrolase [Chitinophaga parva]